MSELEKAYEAMDMLKALDLPISKAQLENIKRLENEHGKEHREDLSSYFYEKCFANYTKRILNIRQAKIRGEVIVAKPVLLLAIIDGININMFNDNKFWHLQFSEEPQEGITPSKHWLREKVNFADFDDDLWLLLQNKVWRLKLRDYIVEHKLKSNFWNDKMVAEGLGILAAIVLAA